MTVFQDFGFYVYISTDRKRKALSTGITGDLINRIRQLEKGLNFIGKDRTLIDCNYIIYWEHFDNPDAAIHRSKVLDKLSYRRKKVLIDIVNPNWKFLNDEVRV